MTKKIKVLFFSASPVNDNFLEVDSEYRQIAEALDREVFELISVSKAKVEDISREVQTHKPQIIHFSGHSSTDEIIFETESNQSQGVKKQAFIEFIKNLSKSPKLIFLNGCKTSINLDELQQFVDFVIATEQSVPDDVAISFAGKFYQALSSEEPLINAFEQTKSAFALKNEGSKVKPYRLIVSPKANRQKAFRKKSEDKDNAPKYQNIIKMDGNSKIEKLIQANKIDTINID